MNVQHFQESLELMSHNGHRLTDFEALQIEHSLIVLQSEHHLSEIFFFGRIDTCTDARYYIAFGYRKDILSGRVFFYSPNGLEWITMPELRRELIPVALHARTLLTGDPAHVEAVCIPPKFVKNNQNVPVPCPRKAKKLKEEDRLVCLVHVILEESAVVPRRSLYRHVTANVSTNPLYFGLSSRAEARNMKNYQMFRHPRNNRYHNLGKHDDYKNYQTDFLDVLDDEVLANCFACTINDRNVCLLRALHWPGMTLAHQLNSPNYAFFYFGNGMKSIDLLF